MNIQNFNQFNLLIERLHINKDVDEYSDKIYDLILNSNKLNFKFTDLPSKLNIKELIINIKVMKPGLSGQLDLNKSKKTESGWIIYIDLKKGFSLFTLKHEMNHALRLTLVGKDVMIKNLNYIKSGSIFSLAKNGDVDRFLYLMYLANDEEINAKIMETNGFIKEVMKKWQVDKISKSDFEYIIKSSDAYRQANELISFSSDKLFKNWKQNDINKLFYTLEENKSELDSIQGGRFSKLKLIIKSFKDVLSNKMELSQVDDKVYKPKKGKKFYDDWIPKQGQKLKKRIYSLYDLYI
jgi:hypothetical protein